MGGERGPTCARLLGSDGGCPLRLPQKYGVPSAGENALQRYDEYAFSRITESAFGQTARAGHLEQLTFLRCEEGRGAGPGRFGPARLTTAMLCRMGDMMFDGANWDAFARFLAKMRSPPGV